MAITSTDIQNFLAANPGMTDAQIVDAMRLYNVSPEQMASAVNLPLQNVQSRMAATERRTGRAGQYGYANNAPILNANVAKSILKDEFYKPLDIAENELGWGTNSKYQGSIRTGAGLYGIEGSKSEIGRLLDIGQKAKEDFAAGKIIATQDPETGETRFAQLVQTDEGPQYSTTAAYDRFNTMGGDGSNAVENLARWQDVTGKLQTAAQTLGINTSGLTDRQILDAVNAKETRVAVSGRTQFWDPNQTGIGGQEGPQHATVVYTQQDGKLIPVAPPQTFTFQDPNTTRGFFGDIGQFALDLAKLPPVQAALAAYFGPQLASYLSSTYSLSPAVANTVANSALSTAIQTAATGSAEQGLQSGLLSAGGSALFGGAQQAGGTGLSIGAGGETGLLSSSGGITGLTAPAGYTFAPDIGSTLVAASSAAQPNLLDTAQFQTSLPEMGGGTGLTPTAAGEGLQIPTMPNIGTMGGGQGITIPVDGGTIGQLGFTPTGATPVLGSPSSFINNPEVLGQPVIQQGTPKPIPISDVLRAANAARQLTGDQPQNAPVDQQVGQMRAGAVDYSDLLRLLTAQARVSGLLGTQFQPQPINLASLLG